MTSASPYLNRPVRSLDQARSDIAARRARLEADLRAEGTSEDMIARLATDDGAKRLLAYERQVLQSVESLFGFAP